MSPSSSSEFTATRDAVALSAEVERSELSGREIPRRRLIGTALLACAAYLHDRFILDTFTERQWAELAFYLLAYVTVAWIAVRHFSERFKRIDVRLFFLITDIFVLTSVIYATGGTRSWLFFIMLAPVADQASTSFRRSVVFAHISTACYGGLIAYLYLQEGRQVDWFTEMAKLFFIYGASLYLSLGARNAELRRNRIRELVRESHERLGIMERLASELDGARARAEESNEAKNEYLANISHEIRTPLSGIIGMAELALASELKPEQRAFIQSAQGSAESLLMIINDILDFSKIEARKVDLEAVHFDLHDRIGEVVKSFGVAAHQKRVELVLEIVPGVPHSVVGDDGKLRQVLVNLIGNAIKFTDSGDIVVRVEASSRTKQDVLLETSVTDSGPGIPAEKQATIFQAYQQADRSIPRRYGGSGLGLSISSRLVELMGGKIRVESNEGKGSTFQFTTRLWLQRIASVEPRPILPPSDVRQRVLVVDDHAATANVLSAMVRHWDLEPSIAFSGDEALAMMEQGLSSGQAFAFVLIDAGMEAPGGFALADHIRSHSQLPGSVVMMLTSPGDFEGAARCREMALPSYVTKPVSSFELSDAITRALHSPLPLMAAVGPQSTQLQTSRSLRVLVAEDDPVNRELAAGLLRRWGHRVTMVADGEECLRELGRTKFDLVVMDVQMPVLDGLQTTQRIREQETATGDHLFIVAASGLVGRADRDRCLAAGVDSYLTKPLKGKELFRQVEELIPRMSSAVAAPVTERREQPDVLISASELVARVDGNVSLAKKITSIFIDESPRMMAALEEAVQAGDSAAVAHHAHRLKGAIANFPAADALASAARLEMMGRRSELTHAPEVFATLREEVEDTVLALGLTLDQLQNEVSAGRA